MIPAQTIENDEDREIQNEYKEMNKNKRKTQQKQKQFIRHTTGKAGKDQWE